VKKEDITVGKKYIHPKIPNAVYLGIGKASFCFWWDKELVLIESDEKDIIGAIVQYPEWDVFWKGLKEMT